NSGLVRAVGGQSREFSEQLIRISQRLQAKEAPPGADGNVCCLVSGYGFSRALVRAAARRATVPAQNGTAPAPANDLRAHGECTFEISEFRLRQGTLGRIRVAWSTSNLLGPEGAPRRITIRNR